MNILSEILGLFSIKRLAVWVGLFLLGFLLRGGLFRQFFNYRAEKRFVLEYKIENTQLTDFIVKHPEVYDREVEDIEHIALIAEKITADALSFSKDSIVFNPNLVFASGGITNDAGYSAFYTTVCDYLIDYYSLKNYYDCRHIVGSCFFRGTNLTTFRTIRGGQPFPSEFHFNVILNLKTGETISLDPTLYDAYRISTVSSNYSVSKP
jgi:hypothetical protein